MFAEASILDGSSCKLVTLGLPVETQHVFFVLIYANSVMVSRSRNNSHAISVLFLTVASVSRAVVYIREYLCLSSSKC